MLDNNLRRKKIRETLDIEAGEDADLQAVTDASQKIWQQIVARLAPVIGMKGVEVLFSRALHEAGKLHACLARVGQLAAGGAVELEQLKAVFESCDIHEAVEASCTLLMQFTDLLASLIGESLTERLTFANWVGQHQAHDKETST
jgi:hypothetical protein